MTEALDFTLIARAIADVMKKAGAGLNEDQYLILVGCISAYAMQIEDMGLDELIKRLDKRLNDK